MELLNCFGPMGVTASRCRTSVCVLALWTYPCFNLNFLKGSKSRKKIKGPLQIAQQIVEVIVNDFIVYFNSKVKKSTRYLYHKYLK